MAHPQHTREELAGTLRKMYPEINAKGIEMSLEFNHEKNAWIVMLSKGRHQLTTHLEKKDADGCMEGIQCVYLGVQIAQLIKNFESGA